MSSLWDRTQKLPKELFKQVEQVYGDHFPLDVRFQLALWIEDNFFSHNVEIKQEDPTSQNMAAHLAQAQKREHSKSLFACLCAV